MDLHRIPLTDNDAYRIGDYLRQSTAIQEINFSYQKENQEYYYEETHHKITEKGYEAIADGLAHSKSIQVLI